MQPVPAKTVLNLGCGERYDEKAVNLDVPGAGVRADVWHDLNAHPWPFAENTFAEIRANDVIEHLHDIVVTMDEIHRIARPDAIVRVTVPHFSSANAFTDPTHRHYFSIFSFNYFTGEHEFHFYTQKRYRMLRKSIIFEPTLVNKAVWRIANRYPAKYERRWAWMFPAWFLNFELQVVK